MEVASGIFRSVAETGIGRWLGSRELARDVTSALPRLAQPCGRVAEPALAETGQYRLVCQP